MDVSEIKTKGAMTRSKIPGVAYVINPYLGCSHGCRYCYASFMAKYSHNHTKALWGTFVEVKINVVEVLYDELSRKKKKGIAMLSSVCDPYQPIEQKYKLTRGCLETLVKFGWDIEILTRSPLVTRDMDIFSYMPKVSVGFSIPTDNESVRQIVEPDSPSINARIDAMKKLYSAGINTWAFIGPMLPMNPRKLYEAIEPYVNHVLIDSLNYRQKVRDLFYKNHWGYALTDEYALNTGAELRSIFRDKARAVYKTP